MSNDLTPSYPFFAMPFSGKPNAGGTVYIGNVGTDPTVPENQKEVRYVQVDGSEVPVAQPLQLSVGGVLTYNGAPAKFVVTDSFSMTVLDSNGELVSYDPDRYPVVP